MAYGNSGITLEMKPGVMMFGGKSSRGSSPMIEKNISLATS